MKKLVLLFILFIPCFVHAQNAGVCCIDTVSENWAEENIEKIKKMTRGEWLKLTSAGKKRAAYVRFTKEQRVGFWKEKLAELETNEKFSVKEKEHVGRLREFVDGHQGFFTGEKMTSDQESELNSFMVVWTERAKKELRWSKQMIFSIVASGEDAVIKYD